MEKNDSLLFRFCRNRQESIRFHPNHENRRLYEGPRLRASPRHGGEGVFLFSDRSAAGAPRRGRRRSSYSGVWGRQPQSF